MLTQEHQTANDKVIEHTEKRLEQFLPNAVKRLMFRLLKIYFHYTRVVLPQSQPNIQSKTKYKLVWSLIGLAVLALILSLLIGTIR